MAIAYKHGTERIIIIIVTKADLRMIYGGNEKIHSDTQIKKVSECFHKSFANQKSVSQIAPHVLVDIIKK